MKAIPEPVTIGGIRYEPMIIQRNGVPAWTGRWLMLVRPTPIAYGINLYYCGTALGSLAVLKPTRELPPQLR